MFNRNVLTIKVWLVGAMVSALLLATFGTSVTWAQNEEIILEAQSLLYSADQSIQQGQYESALQSLTDVYRINSTLKDAVIGKSVLNSMAHIYYNTGQLEQAHRYYSELVALDQQNNDEVSLAVSLFNLGHVYASQERLQLAESTFVESLEISKRLGDESGSAFTYKALGVNAQAQNQLEIARTHLEASLSGFLSVSEERQTGTVYRHLGDVAVAEGQFESAVSYYQKALPILVFYSFDTALLRVYRGLSQAYEFLLDYEKAFISYQAYSELLQVQLQQQNRETAQRLQVEFETKRFAEENGRLVSLSQDQELELEHRQALLKMQYAMMGLGAGIVVLIAIMLWRSRKYANQMKMLATTDELTGLLNRRAIMQFGYNEWHRAHRFNHPLSCLILDVDHFKSINDTWGHAEGDAVLKEISKVMKMTLRKTDALGRFGGEEFLILATESGRQEVMVLAERIRTALESIEYEGRPEHKVTVSIGLAEMSSEASLDELIQHADRALYNAKDRGRNRVVVYKSNSGFSMPTAGC